jgi:hypothetical protein
MEATVHPEHKWASRYQCSFIFEGGEIYSIIKATKEFINLYHCRDLGIASQGLNGSSHDPIGST